MLTGHAVHPATETTLSLVRIVDEHGLLRFAHSLWSSSKRLWRHDEFTVAVGVSDQHPAPAIVIGADLALRFRQGWYRQC